MAAQVRNSDFNHILGIVAAIPWPATIQEIFEKRADLLDLNQRTLQRRVNQLVSEKLLTPIQDGRIRRYTIGEGLDLIDVYQPNETRFLSQESLEKLSKQRRAGMSNSSPETYLRQSLDKFIIDLSWNSSRLEHNSYSLPEAKRLLEKGEIAKGKSDQETQMIVNHKTAIEMLIDQADTLEFNRSILSKIHTILTEGLSPNGYSERYVRPHLINLSHIIDREYLLEIPQQIETQYALMLEKAEVIQDPMEQSLFLLIQMPYLQPFESYNEMVSRLAAQIPLIRHKLCPLAFIGIDTDDYLSAVGSFQYSFLEITPMCDVFVDAYQKSCKRYKPSDRS